MELDSSSLRAEARPTRHTAPQHLSCLCRLLSASVSVDLTLLQACLSYRKQILRHKNMTFSHFTVRFFTIENGHVKFTFSQFAVSLFTIRCFAIRFLKWSDSK